MTRHHVFALPRQDTPREFAQAMRASARDASYELSADELSFLGQLSSLPDRTRVEIIITLATTRIHWHSDHGHGETVWYSLSPGIIAAMRVYIDNRTPQALN